MKGVRGAPFVFKVKKQMPDLSSSLSFSTDRQMGQSLNGLDELTVSPSRQAVQTPLPCWDSPAGTGSHFPAPTVDTDCSSLTPILQWDTEAWKDQLCYPHQSEGRAGFCTRIQFSHLSPGPATAALQNITSDVPIYGSQELSFTFQTTFLGRRVG